MYIIHKSVGALLTKSVSHLDTHTPLSTLSESSSGGSVGLGGMI